MELFLHFPYVEGGLAAKKEFTIPPPLQRKLASLHSSIRWIYVGLLAELGDGRFWPCDDIHGI